MKEILTNEEQLDDLQAILDEYSGNLTKIKERIAHLFEGHSLPASPKLEAVYRAGMTAEELIHALYPSTQPLTVPKQQDDALELSEEEQILRDLNDQLIAEMVFGKSCQSIIPHLKNGNAKYISQETWDRFADFLQNEFCDEYGRWKKHKQGQEKQVKSDEEIQVEQQIANEFEECRKSLDYNYKITKAKLAEKFGKSESTIRDIDAAYSQKMKIYRLCKDFYKNNIDWNEFSVAVHSQKLAKEVPMKSSKKQ